MLLACNPHLLAAAYVLFSDPDAGAHSKPHRCIGDGIFKIRSDLFEMLRGEVAAVIGVAHISDVSCSKWG